MDFNIVNHSGNVDACAQFFYNGKKISMSTLGRSKGACAIPVAVFDGVDFQHHVGDFNSVQDAINFINGDVSYQNLFLNKNLYFLIDK